MEGQNLEQGWPSPRSWERVSNCISMFNGDTNIMRKVVYGLIGNSVGIEFMEFFKMSAEFDSILEVMTNDSIPFELPDKADKRYAISSAVIYHLWNGKTEEDEEKRINGFYKILMKMPNDFAAMMVRAAMLGNKNVKPMDAMRKIMTNKNYASAAKAFANTSKNIGTL
jgi:hypothetical protein